MSDLPPFAWILFSLHQEPAFAQKASELLRASEWTQALNCLRKSKLTLTDMLFVLRVGAKSPLLMKAVAETIRRYKLDQSYAVLSRGFADFIGARVTQLHYFLISDPTQLESFMKIVETGKFPLDSQGSYTYTKAFLYRAALFYVLLSKRDALPMWLEGMESSVLFYPSGSPKGFIRDTHRMVESYLKAAK